MILSAAPSTSNYVRDTILRHAVRRLVRLNASYDVICG